MLVDSGADISVISSELEGKILKINKLTPILPIIGLNVHSAVGNKSTKVDRQILLPIKIKEHIIQVPFIVIAGLNESAIIGNDFLEKYKTLLDFENQSLTLRTEQSTVQTLFTNRQRATT